MTENPKLAIRMSHSNPDCLVIEAKDCSDSCYISYAFDCGSLACDGQKEEDYIPDSDLTEEEIIEVFKVIRDFIIEKRKREDA